ncbi:DUF397 domain-containing protein [Streptomyces sp. NPDC101225]|uniref:DUF397 domain-containing protein n=1 Tax=Streptomyces sp. NPDC101225 TaxID=3366135 RepID=UPI00381F48E4
MVRTFDWRKSTRSGQDTGCVEAACDGEKVTIRDSKRKNGPMIHCYTSTWEDFIAAVISAGGIR